MESSLTPIDYDASGIFGWQFKSDCIQVPDDIILILAKKQIMVSISGSGFDRNISISGKQYPGGTWLLFRDDEHGGYEFMLNKKITLAIDQSLNPFTEGWDEETEAIVTALTSFSQTPKGREWLATLGFVNLDIELQGLEKYEVAIFRQPEFGPVRERWSVTMSGSFYCSLPSATQAFLDSVREARQAIQEEDDDAE